MTSFIPYLRLIDYVQEPMKDQLHEQLVQDLIRMSTYPKYMLKRQIRELLLPYVTNVSQFQSAMGRI